MKKHAWLKVSLLEGKVMKARDVHGELDSTCLPKWEGGLCRQTLPVGRGELFQN